MTCPACLRSASDAHSGAYRMTCLPCCARLVASARPLRGQQEALLAAVEQHLARLAVRPFGRDEVLACVRRMPVRRP